MSDKTGIAWTDATWNPVTGCTKVSAGCKHCYADRVFPRAYHGQDVTCARCDGTGWAYYAHLDNGFNYDDGVRRCKECDGKGSRPRRFTDVLCHPERLGQPLRWRKPRRIFVNSMSDLFHEDVPDDFIAQVFGVMAACIALGPDARRGHTFQVLTKRPARMCDFMASVLPESIAYAAVRYGGGIDPDGVFEQVMRLWPTLPNVWLGVSAEDQANFDARVPVLLDTPAALRFVSLEPMLGPIAMGMETEFAGYRSPPARGSLDHGLDWVIVGGESGPKARPFDIQWARNIVRQCEAAGVSVFVKQLGARPVWRPSSLLVDVSEHMPTPIHSIKHRAGADPEEWPEDLRVQQFPEVA